MPSATAIRNPTTDVNTIWPTPVASATGPSVRIVWKSSLQADHEQQQRDADAREQLNLFVLRDETDAGRADQDADRDEGDDQRLPQPCADSADDGGGQERQRDFGERISGWHGLRLTTPVQPTLSRPDTVTSIRAVLPSAG